MQRRYGLILALAVLVAAPASVGHAQFGDEFGDEFGPEPAPTPQPAPAPQPQPGGAEFGDEFGDEEEQPQEGQPDQPEGEGYDRFAGDEELAEDEFYTGDEAGAEGAEDEVSEEEFEQAFRQHNSWDGPTGGIHTWNAGTGALGSFRVQLLLGFFSTSDFAVPEDSAGWVGDSLSVSWTPFEMVELYLSLQSHAFSNDKENPDLFLVLGDIQLGGKVFTHLTPFLTLGGDLRLYVPTGLDIGIGDALGFRIGANLTADLRELDQPAPFIARFNLGYHLDNTENLIDEVEQRRYDALDEGERLPIEDETAHLISPVERYALGINRTDFFDIGIGVEVPLRAATDFYIHPMLEWTLGIPINRQGYSCLITGEPGDDSCIDEQGLSSFPMSLTLGVRVLPPVRGLAAIAGVDIGLTGTSFEDAVRELALNDPYRVMIGASYAFDTRPHPEPEVIVREIPNEVEVPADVPPTGRLTGFIVDQREQTPVREGIVEIMNHPDLQLNAIVADPSGRFATYRLPPGPVELAVTAEGYEPGGCQGTIPEEGGDVEVRCELVRESRVQIEEEEVIILEQIQFAFDSAEILPESFPLMQDIARTLNEHPEIRRVEIQGHTDTQGSHQYNMDLSQRRADSVMQWLVNAGVDANRLEARGYGFTEPLVPNITEENRARNRRVQFIIKDRAEP